VVLRITEHDGADSGAVLRLEGRFVAEMAEVVERECSRLLGDRAEVTLDLAGVRLVDREAVEVLRRLGLAGAEILCLRGPVGAVLEGAGIHVTLLPDEGLDARH
jgi:anti-anti-sigma regulatory factor